MENVVSTLAGRSVADRQEAYAVEIRTLLDAALTVMREQETIEADALPSTVQSLLAARLDSLDRLERRLLQSASVIGQTFWEGALSSRVWIRESIGIPSVYSGANPRRWRSLDGTGITLDPAR